MKIAPLFSEKTVFSFEVFPPKKTSPIETVYQTLEELQDLHPDVDFETCDELVDAKIIDSFDIVTIITEINDTFDVVISAEQITPENFNSAQAIWALIEELMDED